MGKNNKIVIGLLVLALLILVGKYGYVYLKYEINVSPKEQENRKIDEYNFLQLEKMNSILSNIDKNNKFRTLNEFNKKYGQDIRPIKNCYYMVTMNYFEKYKGKNSYIIGFELESDKYINMYGTEYYAYPKYVLPPHKACFGTKESCTDLTFDDFKNIISNPCED